MATVIKLETESFVILSPFSSWYSVAEWESEFMRDGDMERRHSEKRERERIFFNHIVESC